jgi:hypothetical protein
MKSLASRLLIPAVLLSFVLSYVVYFGFTTNYTVGVFSEQGFNRQYTHGIYKYRILSRYLLITVDHALGNSIPSYGAEPRLIAMDKYASERFYYAYFYLNTAFLMLTAVLLVLILDLDWYASVPYSEKVLLVFLVISLISLTQFVVVPYDVLGYFLETLTIYFFLKYLNKHFVLTIIGASILVLISTLNRESSAMTVAFLFVLLFSSFGFKRKTYIPVTSLIISFLVPYIALRYFVTEPYPHPNLRPYLHDNLVVFENQIGIAFWGLLLFLAITIASTRTNKMLILFFHICSLPYIVACWTGGIFWELRLYLPLLLSSLILSKIEVKTFNSPVYNFN